MNSLKKIPIRLLALSIAITFAVTLLSVFIGIKTMNEDIKESNRWVDHTYKAIININDVLLNVINMETGYRGFLITGDDDFLEPYFAGKDELTSSLEQLIFLTRDNKLQTDTFNEIRRQLDLWQKEVLNKGIDLREEPDSDAVVQFVAEAHGKKYVDLIRELLEIAEVRERELLKERYVANSENISNITIWTAIISTFGFFISGLILTLINRTLSKEIRDVSGNVKQLSEGKLLPIVIAPSKNELYEIRYSLNETTSKLSELIYEIKEASLGVESSVHDVSTVILGTSENISTELKQIEEISIAANELESSAKEVSLSAKKAEVEAEKAIESVRAGNEAIEHSVELTKNVNLSANRAADIINQLEVSAENIGQITEVISTISQKINLLALNAAIESARAGENGKGFSVVAEEVRKLASKTQESIDSIKDLVINLQLESKVAKDRINDNLNFVNESIVFSDSVIKAFSDITSSVNIILETNSLVANASAEQYTVTENVSKRATLTYDLASRNVEAANEIDSALKKVLYFTRKQKEGISFFN